MKYHHIDIDHIKSVLDYNSGTGIFTWRISSARNVKKGDIAGGSHPRGYCMIGINKKIYFAHRLAWAIFYNEQPSQIDHINCITSDNRISNLRECTTTQNNANQKINKSNKSGYKGVHWSNSMQKWKAQIKKNKRCTHLGYFEKIEDAAASYKKEAIKYHGEFARIE